MVTVRRTLTVTVAVLAPPRTCAEKRVVSPGCRSHLATRLSAPGSTSQGKPPVPAEVSVVVRMTRAGAREVAASRSTTAPAGPSTPRATLPPTSTVCALTAICAGRVPVGGGGVTGAVPASSTVRVVSGQPSASRTRAACSAGSTLSAQRSFTAVQAST